MVEVGLGFMIEVGLVLAMGSCVCYRPVWPMVVGAACDGLTDQNFVRPMGSLHSCKMFYRIPPKKQKMFYKRRGREKKRSG
jgi:hypothetical protein